MNSNMPTNSEMDVQVDVGDEQINHVNTELCNLQIQEKKKQDNKSHQQNKVNKHFPFSVFLLIMLSCFSSTNILFFNIRICLICLPVALVCSIC
jgi:hypothetical protein